MQALINYIRAHLIRGQCTCGECIDGAELATNEQPAGHTVDLVFFKVASNPEDPPDLETLRALLLSSGSRTAKLLDGNSYSYFEVGVTVGDQGLALMLMGIGTLVGLWALKTPYRIVPGLDLSHEEALSLAQNGGVAIQVTNPAFALLPSNNGNQSHV